MCHFAHSSRREREMRKREATAPVLNYSFIHYLLLLRMLRDTFNASPRPLRLTLWPHLQGDNNRTCGDYVLSERRCSLEGTGGEGGAGKRWVYCPGFLLHLSAAHCFSRRLFFFFFRRILWARPLGASPCTARRCWTNKCVRCVNVSHEIKTLEEISSKPARVSFYYVFISYPLIAIITFITSSHSGNVFVSWLWVFIFLPGGRFHACRSMRVGGSQTLQVWSLKMDCGHLRGREEGVKIHFIGTFER